MWQLPAYGLTAVLARGVPRGLDAHSVAPARRPAPKAVPRPWGIRSAQHARLWLLHAHLYLPLGACRELPVYGLATGLPAAAILRRACYYLKKMRQSRRLTHFLFYISGDSDYTS